ncbi:MAG: aminofutalosine synthase MqnE [Verrucomicrobia subdivision 3 bacterium]|nr:aminofutalosine synthase MqnE [Limisphaerales bacterium]
MDFILQKSELADLAEKVETGTPLDADEALRLFRTPDLNALGRLAALATERKVGNRASYIVNRYINYSNYCILSCQFCSFARKKRDGDGFELSIEEMVTKAKEALALNITELHIVGGLHPSLPFDYYTEMLRALKALDANLQLKCFTAVEIYHLARLSKQPMPEVLATLKAAGLDSLTGGGAEIFQQDVRDAIARGKETAAEYLEAHRAWHTLGGRSTCTMLFGHVESIEDRIDHLAQLRALQDETGGFTGFIPLPYQPENNAIPVTHPPTGNDALRTIAVSRLFLDNFDHITAYWVGLGMKLAQVALSYGADDLHGTIVEEHIFKMAGAGGGDGQAEAALVKAIREAGKVPVQRNTFYEPLREWTGDTPDAPDDSAPPNVLNDNLATA